MRDNAGYFVDQKETTLAEAFKNAGYNTAAFVSAFVLESRWQLNQGFDLYFDNFNMGQFQDLQIRELQRRGNETETEASHWLDDHKSEKFFAWVHFYDPHDPYDPPDPYKTEYANEPYNGEIAYTDEYVGKLLAKLDSLGLKARTIVVLTSDHGEGLGNHKETSHGMFLYNTTQHIPLFLYAPGAGHGRVTGTVRHVDLAPTILELTGIAPFQSIAGKSLVDLINGKDKAYRVAYSETLYTELHYGWSSLQSITTDQYRYIRAPKAELYDRKADPGDTKNLINDKASIVKVLDQELNELLAKYTASDLASGPQKMDPETEEKLRALGYVSGTVKSTEESRRIDPKDKIHLAQKIHEATYAIQQQHYKKAIQLVLPVLQEDPEMVDAHFAAGVAYLGLREMVSAVDELLKTISLRPDHVMALYNLGFAYEMKGDLNEAKQWYLKILQYEPDHMLATVKLAHIFRVQEQPELARQYFMMAVNSYKDALDTTRGNEVRASLLSSLGEIYFGGGAIQQAEQCFREALQLSPKKETLNYNMAMIFEAKGDIASAAGSYEREIQVDPKNYKAYNNLGILYKDSGRLSDAVRCFQKVMELDPEQPNGYVLLASTYRQMGREQEASQVIRMAQERQVQLPGK